MTTTETILTAADRLEFLASECATGPWALDVRKPGWLASPQNCNGPGCQCGGKGLVAVGWFQSPIDAAYTVSTSPTFGLAVAALLRTAAKSRSAELRAAAVALASELEDGMTDTLETLSRMQEAAREEDAGE